VTNGKTDEQIVKEVLDQLEGHPNFVKANRIVDELRPQTNKAPEQKEKPSEELQENVEERRRSRHS
jgi:hypothetical protein